MKRLTTSFRPEETGMIGADAYIGRLIGGYRLVADISNNPCSYVYRGEQHFHTGRTVAIKLWYSIHLSSQQQPRFLQEGRLLKMLKHPHLLPILDSGIHEDVPYLVTEYAPRGSLRDHIKRQSLHSIPIQESLTILSQVGQALQYVHQLNITHGNLKPENILFTAHGDALLTDVTISALLDAASSAFTHNLSSARYMAPEQFQGMTSKASDQYALGCIAYELLTGSVPFAAADFSALELKHATESPPALTQLNMLLPLRLEEVILKALAKQQAARHASVKDLITALGTARLLQPRLLTTTVWPRATLPALSSFQSPAQLTSTVDMSQKIEHQQAQEDNLPGDPEHSRKPPDIWQQIDIPVPATPEPCEEEGEHQEDVGPLVASPAEACENGAESAQVHTNIVTGQLDVAELATAVSLVIEAPHPQSVSWEQATLPMTVIVDSRAELATGTYAGVTKAVSPTSGGRMGSGRRSGHQGSKYLWLAVTALSIVIAAMIVAISSFALPLALSPRTAAHLTPQARSGAPSTGPSQVPSPLPSPTPSPQPSPRPTATPSPTPSPRPTPTPTSASTSGLVATPSQFYAESDCPFHGHRYTCIATLSLPQGYQGNLAWSASSTGLDQVSLSPSAGVLSPGQQQQVTIQVRATCPISGSLTFSAGGSTITVPWSC